MKDVIGILTPIIIALVFLDILIGVISFEQKKKEKRQAAGRWKGGARLIDGDKMINTVADMAHEGDANSIEKCLYLSEVVIAMNQCRIDTIEYTAKTVEHINGLEYELNEIEKV